MQAEAHGEATPPGRVVVPAREGRGAQFGFAEIEIPQPINLFTNIPVGPDGTLDWQPALTEAGDWIALRAELDCIVVLTACAQDILPINDKNPTALAIDVLDRDEGSGIGGSG
jgi:uncharacterized protein YcgI (DUF1989 family)